MTNNISNIPSNKYFHTIGELPTSYLVSLTYEEQLIWLSNYLEKTILPALNNVIDSFNDLNEEYHKDFADFVQYITDNLTPIAQEVIQNMIVSGELIVTMGEDYNETNESLRLYIDSILSSDLQQRLATLTTPERSED